MAHGNSQADSIDHGGAHPTALDKAATADHYGRINKTNRRVFRGADNTTTTTKLKTIYVPLNLYFSQNPSKYFALESISNGLDVQVHIKLRKFEELMFEWTGSDLYNGGSNRGVSYAEGVESCTMKLAAQYFELQGPEAASLVNRSQSYLLHQMQSQTTLKKTSEIPAGGSKTFVIDLQFLHPVKCLYVMIRHSSDLNGGSASDHPRNYFALVGHPDRPHNMDVPNLQRVTVDDFDLEFNSTKMNNGTAITRDYMMKRLKPQHHTCGYEDGFVKDGGTEEIYCIPFCMAPESLNPSGHINFSKIANAKMHITMSKEVAAVSGDGRVDIADSDSLHIDVFALCYNWAVYDKGRGHVAFN
jgi:hypothetical protein